ncbi:MAG: hypothetical protein M1817_004089 [Caeruleum heppii]|nr:MAG: hypothetical protein M1817_004089 [Caeruleum heppii]
MPLILITGYPSSGKTHRARQLHDFFTTKIQANARSTTPDPRLARLQAHHISDQTLNLSRHVYQDDRREKDARAAEISAVKRHIGKDDVVIADGLNYIKGFRYQLYCEAKAAATPSCVVHVGTPVDTCRDINTRLLADHDRDGGYPPDIFDALIFRYEEPNGMTRWDSPLFTVLHDDAAPPLDDIWETMIGSEGKSKVIKPHRTTVTHHAPNPNYLYELDRVTQEIVATILSYQKDHEGEGGGTMNVQNSDAQILLPGTTMSVPQLQRIRRQFITMNRQHTLDLSRITDLFVDYLNASLER